MSQGALFKKLQHIVGTWSAADSSVHLSACLWTDCFCYLLTGLVYRCTMSWVLLYRPYIDFIWNLFSRPSLSNEAEANPNSRYTWIIAVCCRFCRGLLIWTIHNGILMSLSVQELVFCLWFPPELSLTFYFFCLHHVQTFFNCLLV